MSTPPGSTVRLSRRRESDATPRAGLPHHHQRRKQCRQLRAWLALILGMATCIVNPDVAREVVVRVQRWTGQHSRTLLLGASFTVGVVLVVRGALLVAGAAS